MIHIEMSKADMIYKIPHEIESQAMIWSDIFNEFGDPEDFISIAEQLEMEGKLHNIVSSGSIYQSVELCIRKWGSYFSERTKLM